MARLLFAKLAELYEQLEKITSGNAIRALISAFLKKVPKKNVEQVTYMTVGQIASEYEDINIGIAEKMVLRAIATTADKDYATITALYKKLGDTGLVAEKLVGKKRKNLPVNEVFNALHDIARATGAGSQRKKTLILAHLLKTASPIEARYICRIVLGTLRLGVGDMTVLDSLAIAFTGSKKAKKELEQAYNICPDIGIIAKTLATKGLKSVRKIKTVIGRPIQMMLAQRIGKFEELKEKINGSIAAEEKYDGERIQAHKKGRTTILYSRRLENITREFPEIAEQIQENVKAKNCIIEGDCVAVDAQGNLLPFQVIMQRKRKYDIQEYIKKVPVCFYVFDLLNLHGVSYIDTAYPARRALLKRIVKETQRLQLAKQIVSTNLDDIEEFFNKTVERGGEGIIAKSCASNSFYTPGKRGWLWIKWKREYAAKMADTFDLAVVGAYHGRGKRGGTYGALLCAAYNSTADRFETVCKLGSGFTDEELKTLPKKFRKYETKTKPARVIVHKNLVPDVWFTPAIVVEVVGAEITQSPIHTAGKGLALRFPRFIKYRPEKKPEQATTVKEIEAMAEK
ncbi:ATP-dependent DNA ligase [Candidatus Woesearchaeota archaeon]|nr:ATP-dependent DNA ligase [Candidatus Woesearchaeota archaeon]